jgi:hypothetical protein
VSDVQTVDIPLHTAADGTCSEELRIYGVVEAIALRLGSLSTATIVVTDGLSGAPILTITSAAASARYQPRVKCQDTGGADIDTMFDKPAVTGRINVTVTGGGNSKDGALIVLYTG